MENSYELTIALDYLNILASRELISYHVIWKGEWWHLGKVVEILRWEWYWTTGLWREQRNEEQRHKWRVKSRRSAALVRIDCRPSTASTPSAGSPTTNASTPSAALAELHSQPSISNRLDLGLFTRLF
jgi:hypothetical protein